MIKIPENSYVNLYAESGITVGTRIVVQNVTSADIRLFSTSSTPTGLNDWKLLQPGKQMINETGDVGAWAYCVGDAGVTVVTV